MPFNNTSVLIPLATVARVETRTVGEGKVKTELLVAVDRHHGRDSGPAHWFSIVTWGRTAENVAKYSGKGQRVSISGHLEGTFWQDKNGANRRTTEIVGDSVQFLTRVPAARDEDLPARQVERSRVVRDQAAR